jgi:hypothetical protein
VPLWLLWDFGLNPTCIVTQVTPMGNWLILDSMVGDGIGVEELIENEVRPLLTTRYARFKRMWSHIGDPAGQNREQSSSKRNAVRSLKLSLGGSWKSGPVKEDERFEPLRAVLTRTVGGSGLVQVDRERGEEVWYALRGGWHYPVNRNGQVSIHPLKTDKHSHPGDAMGYGAAILWPMGKLGRAHQGEGATYDDGPVYGFGRDVAPLGFERPGLTLPSHGSTLDAE